MTLFGHDKLPVMAEFMSRDKKIERNLMIIAVIVMIHTYFRIMTKLWHF